MDKCLKCGAEALVEDAFCRYCGHPRKAVVCDGAVMDLKTLYIDVRTGVMLVNGHEVNNVTAFSLQFNKGKYGLNIVVDEMYQATAPLNIEKEV